MAGCAFCPSPRRLSRVELVHGLIVQPWDVHWSISEAQCDSISEAQCDSISEAQCDMLIPVTKCSAR